MVNLFGRALLHICTLAESDMNPEMMTAILMHCCSDGTPNN